MKITGLQNSREIEKHLIQLNLDVNGSNNKSLLNKFIKYWQLKYFVALEEEREMAKLRLKLI
jgi:hypothetical protein|tara:strand:+ start:364 stop:549 length:186 start_codon:yes stop_codon:yes gene_type:complete